MVISMILDEFLLKWMKNKKNLYGLVGFTIIMAVLAADFAYWAGEISINAAMATGPGDDTEVEEEIQWEEVLVFHFEEEDTIMAPGFGVIGGSSTTKSYDFPVEENASKAEITTTHTGTNLSPDVDLEVFGADGESAGSSGNQDAEEAITLKERDFDNHGYGTYRADVHNFRNVAITYKITIDVYYKVPANETDEGD
jgi:hypothetical protein